LGKSGNLKDIFGKIEDHRSHINQLHDPVDILLIGIIAVICGAETWEQMVRFAKSKEPFLKKFLELPNVISSKVTLNRVFSAIDSQQFESYFTEWVNSISDLSKGQIIAIDGKTIRSAKSDGKKSNEITSIPELINMLNIAGNTITIDAMGTQKEITKKIIAQDADYILAVKGNQPQLLENIEDEFRFSGQSEIYTNHNLDHGRIETRTCSVIKNFRFIKQNSGWENLKSIIKIERTREFKNSEKATEKATRYYISSLQNNANDFQDKIRSHWTLDVCFSKDNSRKRADNAAQNYSILLKIALNILKNDSSKKLSIKK